MDVVAPRSVSMLGRVGRSTEQDTGAHARAWIAFLAGALLVVSPLRVIWARESAGIGGPVLLRVGLVALLVWLTWRRER
jgi:hypothetical protein